jgi:hypothetical protein
MNRGTQPASAASKTAQENSAMKAFSAFVFAVLIGISTLAAADPKPGSEASVNVTVVGILRTGMVVIGGETTGTTVTAKGTTWELDLGKNNEFAEAVKMLDGKKVVVRGRLERRPGVEVKERRIVIVSGLQAAGESDQ